MHDELTSHDLAERVAEGFARGGAAPAVLTSAGGVISFAELWQRSAAFAPMIARHAPPHGVVPLFLSRSVDCLALMLACVRTGRAFAVISDRFRAAQLERVVGQSGSRVLWVDGPGIMTLKKGRGDVHHLRQVAVLAVQNDRWLPLHEKQAGALQDVLDVQRVRAADLRTGDAEDADGGGEPLGAAACLFTSGSTGAPKGVLISGADLVSRADEEIAAFGLQPGNRLLNVLPWSFDVGLNQVLTSWLGACPLVILESWLPVDIAEAARRFAVTGISAVPAIWTDFLAAGVAFAAPKPRYVTVSGGSLSAAAQARFLAHMDGIRVIKTYGQTETFRSTLADPDDIAAAPGSVGRPFGSARVYIVDERLRPVPAGDEGEVLHTGGGVMLGYLDGLDQEKRIANPFFGLDGDTSRHAIRTGDRGRLDGAGRLFLLGRNDDLVKVQGNRVYLSEVQAEAERLADVREAQAIAMRHEEETLLFVFIAADGAGLPAADVARRLSARLPTYMIPKEVIVLDDFPRTPSGKPDLQILTRWAEQRLPGSAAAVGDDIMRS